MTYIPPTQKRAFVLTSNRDELELRPTLPPEIYTYDNCKLIFPKDGKAGGSWIAISDKGNINCLLNGGFIPHSKEEHHTQSRGTILVDFTLSALSTNAYFAQKDLRAVEPFTIVALNQSNGTMQNLATFIWDGNQKHFRQLDICSPHIWSSVTLYNEDQRNAKKEWFDRFYEEHKSSITKDKILDFHSGNPTNDHPIGLVTSREGGLKTVSITQVSMSKDKMQMSYFDLMNSSLREIEL
ncbi:MAG: NRDE family protein [Salinivirgaceae bacterium]